MFLPRAISSPASSLRGPARQLPAQMPAPYSQFWRAAWKDTRLVSVPLTVKGRTEAAQQLYRGPAVEGATTVRAGIKPGLARNHPVLILSGHRLRLLGWLHRSFTFSPMRPVGPGRRPPSPSGRDSVIAVRAAV